jgi:hypothetical protein
MEDALTELLTIDMDKMDTLGETIYKPDVPPRFKSARKAATEADFTPRTTTTEIQRAARRGAP